MATNPLIALQGKGVDIGGAFQNALLNISNIDRIKQERELAPIKERLLRSRADISEAEVPTETQLATQDELDNLKSVAFTASRFLPDLQAGNIEGVRKTLQRNVETVQARGGDARDSLEALQLLDENPAQLMTQSQQAITLNNQLNPTKKTTGPVASAKTEILESGATIQALPDGSVEVRNPLGAVVTGQVRLDTLQEAREQKQRTAREKAALTVETAGKVERVKQRQQRVSAVTKELSQRNRDAARASRTTRKAMTIAQQASQGLSGAAKLQLSRLLPGIDSSDEAALDATLKQLALEQLQQFKGPTTDFEFGVTESIAGSLGQSKEANIARIKSLDRANWFNQREFDQFDKFVKSGGDPDTFRFNFGEPVKTKKGIFTLQDIQDTAVQNNLTIEETIKRLNR